MRISSISEASRKARESAKALMNCGRAPTTVATLFRLSRLCMLVRILAQILDAADDVIERTSGRWLRHKSSVGAHLVVPKPWHLCVKVMRQSFRGGNRRSLASLPVLAVPRLRRQCERGLQAFCLRPEPRLTRVGRHVGQQRVDGDAPQLVDAMTLTSPKQTVRGAHRDLVLSQLRPPGEQPGPFELMARFDNHSRNSRKRGAVLIEELTQESAVTIDEALKTQRDD